MWQPSNNIEEDRLEKLNQLKARGIEAYPRRATRTHTTAQAIAAFEAAEKANPEAPADVEVTVAGRLRRVNVKGKVSFAHYDDEHGRLQLFLRINDMPEEEYQLLRDKFVNVDDFVQAGGTMMRTQAGEISVRVKNFR